MKTIIVSLSSKNIHKMPAAWCIKEYCRSQGVSVGIIEGSVNEQLRDLTARIYRERPDIVGFSCYIWNIEAVRKIAADLKKLLGALTIVLGGPEVSFETDFSSFPFADYIVSGAGEEAFCKLIKRLESGLREEKSIIKGNGKSFEELPCPYSCGYFESFKDEQISDPAKRLVYYESSRGCPFSCSYCLSSACSGVEYLPLERVRQDILRFIENGVKCVKFTDRTFNADHKRCAKILEFIGSLDTDCAFHFEAAADLFNETLLKIVEALPKGRVQFEIGIQSVNEKTLEAVNRRTDTAAALKNIARLVSFANCHIHADLIAGLPFETFDSFARGVDALMDTKAHCVQLGFLKILKGSLMSKNLSGAVFSDYPPYEVLKTDTMTFEQLDKLQKIEAAADKFYNGGFCRQSLNICVKKAFGGSWFGFFDALAQFIPDSNFKLNLKSCYSVLLSFMQKYMSAAEAGHYIKLDCFSFGDFRALPDSIEELRLRDKEKEFFKTAENKNVKVRAEYFPFDKTQRLFFF